MENRVGMLQTCNLHVCEPYRTYVVKEENMSELNRNLASKYFRWGPYQYYQIIVSSVNVNQCITRLKSYEYGYEMGGLPRFF